MEVVEELALGIVSAAVGFAIGALVFAIVRIVRWAILRADRVMTATDPQGRQWTIRIPLVPSGARLWASQWLFEMRPRDRERRVRQSQSPDSVSSDELAHPGHLVSETGELAAISAAFILVLALLALAAFLMEIVVVIFVGVAVAAVRVAGGTWQCEVTSPDGERHRFSASSLGQARVRRTDLANSISVLGTVPSSALTPRE